MINKTPPVSGTICMAEGTDMHSAIVDDQEESCPLPLASSSLPKAIELRSPNMHQPGPPLTLTIGSFSIKRHAYGKLALRQLKASSQGKIHSLQKERRLLISFIVICLGTCKSACAQIYVELHFAEGPQVGPLQRGIHNRSPAAAWDECGNLPDPHKT